MTSLKSHRDEKPELGFKLGFSDFRVLFHLRYFLALHYPLEI